MYIPVPKMVLLGPLILFKDKKLHVQPFKEIWLWTQYLNHLRFTEAESVHHYQTRWDASNDNFRVKFAMLEKGKRAISVAGAKGWIKEDRSLETFKLKVKSFYLYECKRSDVLFIFFLSFSIYFLW